MTYLEKRDLKRVSLVLGFSALLVITFAVMSPINVLAAQSASSTLPVDLALSEGNFSIIWITDTQYLSESYPKYFDSLCRWIVDNSGTYNVKMVVHTGDLVEDEWNRTHWENANNSMSILMNYDVPYCWNAGNHDYNVSYWIGNQYIAFNPDVMAEKPYWIGDEASGQSTAVHFNVFGWDCLVLNIAYQADDSALVWANGILDAYPNSHAIVATHTYLNTTGGYGTKGKDDSDWPMNFKKTVLDIHSNVFLTLSAHVYPTTGSRTKVGGRDELMFNRQDSDSRLGAASLRILTFDVAQGLIDVKTFLLYANNFLTDGNNQFTLNSTFRNDYAGKEENVTSDDGEGFPIMLVLSASGIVVASVLFLVSWRLRRRNRTKGTKDVLTQKKGG
jgi:hypothetical protein